MPLRCTILDDYQNVALTLADWSSLSPEIDVQACSQYLPDEATVAAQIADADIVVIMRERTPFPASLFARLPNLKLLVTSGMRNQSIDLVAAARHGVTVCGTGSGSDAPVEMTWALMLGLARHLVAENQALRHNGPWQSTVGTTLRGKRLGLVGLGKIGGRVASIAQAFGMVVSAWSPNLTVERAAAADVTLAPSLQALMAESDVISLHIVLDERSRGLIGAAELASMKKSAWLINTSRAGLVDQAALLAVLQAQRIGGAGLDVFEIEPLPADHPFRTLPNCLCTPHLGYVADDNYRTYFTEAVADILAWQAGTPVRQLA